MGFPHFSNVEYTPYINTRYLTKQKLAFQFWANKYKLSFSCWFSCCFCFFWDTQTLAIPRAENHNLKPGLIRICAARTFACAKNENIEPRTENLLNVFYPFIWVNCLVWVVFSSTDKIHTSEMGISRNELMKVHLQYYAYATWHTTRYISR